MTAADTILGTWRRTSAEDCAARYPEEIGFLEGGIYIAEAPAGEFRQWQSGDYELVGERQIRIQTANDAMRLYGFSIGVDGKLRFVDDDRCEITYERVARE